MSSALWSSVRFFPVLLAVAACGDSGNDAPSIDAPVVMPDSPLIPDGSATCDPAGVLPATFRPIAKVSTGEVAVTTTDNVTSGTIDATAGGVGMSSDNPYIYINLKTGTRVEVTDLEARTSTEWDVALKRASIRTNSGDSGTGGRQTAVVQAATVAEVTAVPADGYKADDFTTADCELDFIGRDEPNSAVGEWYNYDGPTMRLSPKDQVYVIKRSDGSSTAFKVTAYYTVVSGAERSALYGVAWKQL